MNHTEAAQYIKATLTAFGPGEAISMTKETWAKIHEAMRVLAQPEQSQVEETLRYEIDALETKLAECRAQQEHVATSDTSEKRVDETAKQRHEPEPVIDKSAAIRIATSLGWEPKRTWLGLTDEEMDTEADKKEQGYGFIQGALWAEDKLKEKNT